MNFVKKGISLFLSIIFIFSFEFAVTAETEKKEYYIESEKYLSSVSYNSNLNKELSKAWDSYATELNIYKYKIRPNEISKIYNQISDLYPEYFYLDFNNTKFSVSKNYVELIKPAYLHSESNRNIHRKRLDKMVNKIISTASGIVSQEDKILYFHDYISSHNKYDPNGLNGDIDSVKNYSFTAYGCLVGNLSVCQGMADAFLLLCKNAGIPAGIVNSESMIHAWNYVKINNQNYHLDITWDDSLIDLGLREYISEEFNDLKGIVSHNYFLKSDQKFLQLNHSDWESDFSAAKSNAYDGNNYWDNIYSPIYYIKGKQYFIRNSKIIKRDPFSKNETVLYKINNGKFNSNGSSFNWNSKYAVLGYNFTDNFLFINLSDGIYAFNLASKEITKILDSPENGYIAGFYIENNTIYYDVADVKNQKLYFKETLKNSITIPEYSVEYGNVDNLDEFEITDIYDLKASLADPSKEINEFAADVNEDNIIDTKDVLLMMKKFAGYNVLFGR